MKKSRIAKLALSGAAVAALAATFSTSTYAWYVSSRKADVTGGTGQTGTVGSDGSVLVSWNGTKWLRTITFSDTEASGKHNAAQANLQPVHYSATDKDSQADAGFYKLSATGAQGEKCSANEVLTFTIYIKSDLETGYHTTITPTVSFSFYGSDSSRSTPATPDKQLALLADGLPTNVTVNSDFCVDAKDSTYIQQNVGGSLSYFAADGASTHPTGTVTGGNAHDYYEAVTANTLSWATTTNSAAATSTSLDTFELTSAAPQKTITYTIFLDGGDLDCFNSAAGQYFKFDLSFSATTPSNS